MAGDRIIEFEKEGVIFILPGALDNVHVGREDLQPIPYKNYPAKRDVIRVSLPGIGGTAEQNLKGADLTLIVYYTYDDAVRAKKIRAEKISAGAVPANEAYLDKPFLLIHDGNGWHEFKGKSVIYQSMSGSRKWVGSMMIKMSRWEDPLIGVGP